MSKLPDVLWLNTSPSLQCFNQPCCVTGWASNNGQWEYCQSHEASSLDVAVLLLHDYQLLQSTYAFDWS